MTHDKSKSYRGYRPNLALYGEISNRFTKPFAPRDYTYAGCRDEIELSNLMGALFYICELGALAPEHQAEFAVLKDWHPGDPLPYECAELLRAPEA